MPEHHDENEQVWFPDDQHGYSIAICECEGGAYLGARQMGTPCVCERCGRLTREQWEFLVESMTANLRMQYEASQSALSDLMTEHRVTVEAVENLVREWEQISGSNTAAVEQWHDAAAWLDRTLDASNPPGTTAGGDAG